MGDVTLLMAEWSGVAATYPYRAFESLRTQRAAARYLRERVPPTETVGVIGFSRPMRYLTKRRVLSIDELVKLGEWSAGSFPERLLVTPTVGTYLFLPASGVWWFKKNCEVEASFGGYWFYRVTGTYPAQPGMLKATVSPHRFHPIWRQGGKRVDDPE
jgi:hypothetical protein